MRYNMGIMLYVKNFLASMLAGNVINRKKYKQIWNHEVYIHGQNQLYLFCA